MQHDTWPKSQHISYLTGPELLERYGLLFY